jgi:hypothetical protein
MGGLRAGIALSLIGVAGLLWDLQRRVVPAIRSSQEEISALGTLEADVRVLRDRLAPGADPLEQRAWQGVFPDWVELAGWLESVRSSADSAQGDLEWTVEEGGLQDPRFPQLQVVRVTWTFSPSDPSFRHSLAFVHRRVVDGKRLIALESIGMESDEIGVRTVKFRVRAWIRSPHG